MLQVDKDVRRLYPEISFFSQPTEHPNERVVFGKHERLHQRVHQTVLKSQSLERKGMGVQKVSTILGKHKRKGWVFITLIITLHFNYLNICV